ncbi:Nitrogen regulation protein NR1 [Salmonella enterica subsp. enterica serovar Give str. S5-487]|nr:Nitrogen regulation protein NR1 [Salmonella enterica subsp. enterica serovar Give str. S5-487]
MSFSVEVLAGIAIELQRGIGHQDRFQRLITTLRQVLACDASALLRYESRQFIPLAIDGLAQDVLGRRFTLEGHPRLEAIARAAPRGGRGAFSGRAGDVVRFPADSDLPDPYDGLIPGQESLKVHACVGLPLFAGQNLIGALTLDAMTPEQFEVFSDEELRLVAALAAGALSNALLIEQLESQNMLPGSSGVFEPIKETHMIGLSPAMTQLKKEIEIVAGSDLNVLIGGETGTGKELVAKAIHQGSPRAVNPLVYLNCAALPESVAESELFGHVKGAFTGAISNRSGKFEMADNGTLFLDEIGELSLALQAKLLRVLQYGDIQRVGDDRSLRVDVRVLAATNRDLREEVLAGRFRADLFHRLSVFPLFVPPLRERGDDVVLLAGYFCEQCRLRLGLSRVVLSPDARRHLLNYGWPGNVRELEHAIHRAVVLARATRAGDEVILEAQHFALSEDVLPAPPAESFLALPTCRNLRESTENFQREMIRQALAQNNHNWAASARALEISRVSTIGSAGAGNRRRQPASAGEASGTEGLDNPCLVEILQVNGAGEFAVFIDHWRGGNFAFHQDLFGVNGAALRLERNTVGRHGFAYRRGERAAAHQPATQVAVGKDAFHNMLLIANRHQPQSGTAKFQHGIHHAGGEHHLRYCIALAHQVMHIIEQTRAQCASRMRTGEIFFVKTARLHDRHRQRIAHH